MQKNTKEILNFHLKTDFYRQKNSFVIWNRVYSDRPKLDLSDLA